MFAKLTKACAAALLLVVFACGGGAVSQDNYDKVKNDMTLDEVKDILGDPTETPAAGAIGNFSGGIYVWTDGDKTISVTMANGKVTLKTKKGF